jgi:hemolysin activation/secretion protein
MYLHSGFTLAHVRAHTHTHTHSLSLSLSLTHTHTHTLALSLARSLKHTRTQVAELPTQYDDHAYRRFISHYGTHIVTFVEYGGSATMMTHGQACLLHAGEHVHKYASSA